MDNLSLKDIMSQYPVTLSPNDNLHKIAELFKKNDFHHLPVVNESGEVIGMISKSDYLLLCDHRTLFLGSEETEENQKFFRSILAEDVMVKPVAKLRASAPVSVAVGFFKENLFHSIPIVNEQDQLVGIVTTLDLINHAFP